MFVSQANRMGVYKMFKVKKLVAGMYMVKTTTGTFEVHSLLQGYGDNWWMVIYPDGTTGDPAPTKRAAYGYIRSYTEMYPENQDRFS